MFDHKLSNLYICIRNINVNINLQCMPTIVYVFCIMHVFVYALDWISFIPFCLIT